MNVSRPIPEFDPESTLREYGDDGHDEDGLTVTCATCLGDGVVGKLRCCVECDGTGLASRFLVERTV